MECGAGGGAGETGAGPEEEVDDQGRAGSEECPHGLKAVLLVSQYYVYLYSHTDMYYPPTAIEPHSLPSWSIACTQWA